MNSTNHIDIDSARCGGKPCIAGTRVRVWDVHLWHDLRGRSPEEVVAIFPQLTLADVHAALAYYLDHREEIERQMAEADEIATAAEQAQGPTRFSRLRDQLLGQPSHVDPVASR